MLVDEGSRKVAQIGMCGEFAGNLPGPDACSVLFQICYGFVGERYLYDKKNHEGFGQGLASRFGFHILSILVYLSATTT